MLKAICGVLLTLSTSLYLTSAPAQLLAAASATASWKRTRAWSSSALLGCWACAAEPAVRERPTRPAARARRAALEWESQDVCIGSFSLGRGPVGPMLTRRAGTVRNRWREAPRAGGIFPR